MVVIIVWTTEIALISLNGVVLCESVGLAVIASTNHCHLRAAVTNGSLIASHRRAHQSRNRVAFSPVAKCWKSTSRPQPGRGVPRAFTLTPMKCLKALQESLGTIVRQSKRRWSNLAPETGFGIAERGLNSDRRRCVAARSGKPC